MDAAEILHHLRSRGISLKAVGDMIEASPRANLSNEVRDLIRDHKTGLMRELRVDLGRLLLSDFAREFDYPLSDLLEWYCDDLETFGSIPRQQAYACVTDYVTRPGVCKRR